MATREEIINGIQLLIQESQRVAGSLTAADWARAQDMDGWKNNQVLAHVASVGGIIAPMMHGMVNAPDGANAGAGIDIDALNAAMVGQRKDKAIDALAAEVKTAYTAAIEHIPYEGGKPLVDIRAPLAELEETADRYRTGWLRVTVKIEDGRAEFSVRRGGEAPQR